jgi:hypothetical protein
VLHFATHGVPVGEREAILKAKAVPALIRTPPKAQTSAGTSRIWHWVTGRAAHTGANGVETCRVPPPFPDLPLSGVLAPLIEPVRDEQF